MSGLHCINCPAYRVYTGSTFYSVQVVHFTLFVQVVLFKLAVQVVQFTLYRLDSFQCTGCKVYIVCIDSPAYDVGTEIHRHSYTICKDYPADLFSTDCLAHIVHRIN